MRRLMLCATLLACSGPGPARRVPAIPSIPLARSELWRCTAAEAPVVMVTGAEPEQVEIIVEGVVHTARCALVPLR